jgi:hypothetical protein
VRLRCSCAERVERTASEGARRWRNFARSRTRGVGKQLARRLCVSVRGRRRQCGRARAKTRAHTDRARCGAEERRGGVLHKYAARRSRAQRFSVIRP